MISISRPAEWFRRQSGTRRAVLVAAAVIVLSIGLTFASRTSLFDARRIEVTGADHVHRADIVRIAGVSKQTNVLWFDERAAERRLEAEPWIANADVSATFPLAIEIAVTERTPVALLGGVSGGLIAGDGTALGTPAAGRGLPTIEFGTVSSAEGAPQDPVGAAQALGAMPSALRSDVRRVVVMLDGTLELRLRGGTKVRFGTPDDAADKVEAIQRALRWANEEGSSIRTLSVVAPSAPAATLVR